MFSSIAVSSAGDSTTSSGALISSTASTTSSVSTSGSATGDVHTLRTEGAVLELTDDSTSVKANTTDDLTDDEGVFTLKFDVTAFETDLYIDDVATRGTSMGTAGVSYTVNTSGAATTTGTIISAELTSSASLDSSTRYKVAEGETESFTLTVNYDPSIRTSYRLQLYSVNFATTNAVPATQQLALPVEDFDTESLSI